MPEAPERASSDVRMSVLGAPSLPPPPPPSMRNEQPVNWLVARSPPPSGPERSASEVPMSMLGGSNQPPPPDEEDLGRSSSMPVSLPRSRLARFGFRTRSGKPDKLGMTRVEVSNEL